MTSLRTQEPARRRASRRRAICRRPRKGRLRRRRRGGPEAKPAPPRELNGRGGLDPSRYGDWEVKGIASDF